MALAVGVLVVGAGCDFPDATDEARDAAVESARQGLDDFRDGFSYQLRQAAGQTWTGQRLREEIEPGLRDRGKDSHLLAVTADGRRVTAQFAVNGRGAGGGGTYEEFSWVTCASVTGTPAPDRHLRSRPSRVPPISRCRTCGHMSTR
ncbi:hypothetical protein Q0Z83_087540 [Actinoplanes sichuanensis]|uniref:Uncharacterized protein n=1 Tax=Actinoplanes sichuanensis TaxID=512349 RepID=A0ABW4A411_9ACTN|nr:hypothetical protein [Actinoplanes sichuanensis]BEL10563.1 hypothetical protein Q0Z83_087540 [Actinoplanes sichuanensis]